MFEETLHHVISGVNIKFTIRDRIIDKEIFYFANVINTNLDFYKNLSSPEQIAYVGMEISDGKGNKINYRNLEKLKKDILTKYGKEWLETEK